MVSTLQLHKIQMWITRGRVINEELYAQRFHRLIHLHLFTEYFMKILSSSIGKVLTIEEKCSRIWNSL